MPTQLFEMMLTKLKRILYCAPSCAKAYDQAHQHFTDNMKWMSVPGIKMIQPFQHVHQGFCLSNNAFNFRSVTAPPFTGLSSPLCRSEAYPTISAVHH
jgi:hypothetical protein